MNRIEPGDIHRLKVVIRDIDAVPGDPTALTFTMNEPDGTAKAWVWETDNEVVRESPGVFYVDFAITKTGTHRYQWKAEGTNASVAEDVFIAQRLRVISP